MSIKKLILVPAVITLAVTLLRLVGELMHWSPRLFNPAPGGGGALVGIAWLVPVFGAWFGWTLAKAGEGPAGVGRAVGFALLACAVVPAVGYATLKMGLPQQSFTTFAIFVVASLAGAWIAYRGWPALGRVLFSYGLAARIPVVIVMLLAMLGNWGTHYDAPPADFPAMGTLARWFLTGVVPQLTFWMYFTIALGALCGAIAAAIARTPRTAPAVA